MEDFNPNAPISEIVSQFGMICKNCKWWVQYVPSICSKNMG
jgi:hypothetical protein